MSLIREHDGQIAAKTLNECCRLSGFIQCSSYTSSSLNYQNNVISKDQCIILAIIILHCVYTHFIMRVAKIKL